MENKKLFNDEDFEKVSGGFGEEMKRARSNLLVNTENVQAAESTIRDTEMAMEMTELTKNKELLEAAQSMLSQANQNSYDVQSLLK